MTSGAGPTYRGEFIARNPTSVRRDHGQKRRIPDGPPDRWSIPSALDDSIAKNFPERCSAFHNPGYRTARTASSCPERFLCTARRCSSDIETPSRSTLLSVVNGKCQHNMVGAMSWWRHRSGRYRVKHRSLAPHGHEPLIQMTASSEALDQAGDQLVRCPRGYAFLVGPASCGWAWGLDAVATGVVPGRVGRRG